ncbi:bud neck involved protein [Thecaphora frezii]
MALSLSLNWSPPSSTLFDDDTGTKTNRSSSDTARQASGAGADRSEAGASIKAHPNQGPARTASPVSAPLKESAALAQAKASADPQGYYHAHEQRYPSVVASQPQQLQNWPMFGSQFQQQPFGQSTPGYFAPMPPQQNQFTWAQYQQMLQAQAQQFYQQAAASDISASSDGRRRTSSVPQRPPNVTYNDTFRQQQQQQQQQQVPQGYPGVGFAAGQAPMQMRGYPGGPGMAPGGVVPTGQFVPTHSASSSISSSTGGYHPYRRTPQQRGNSDVGAPAANSIQFGQLPPPGAVPMAGSGGPPRVRTSSTNSVGSAREHMSSSSPQVGSERKRGLSGNSSSSHAATAAAATASGSVRSQGPSSNSTQAGLAHLRGAPPRSGSQSSLASERSARQAPSSDGGSKASGPSQHGRNESTSSTISASGVRTGGAAAGSAAAAKRPSPLSRQSAQRDDDDDDDGRAVYGGSDDDQRPEGGRTTPVPGGKTKKSGLSGKLRKALSFSNMAEMQQAAESQRGGMARAPFGSLGGGHPNSSGDTNGSTGSTRSTSPPRTPDNGVTPGSSAASISSRRSARPPLSSANDSKRGIFNRKFNTSTDNISISSTVSSASVMLRKVGNLGKLARRHSLMTLTNMFNKDKEREGRDGLHNDSFGTLPGSADDSAIGSGANGKGRKSKSKKASPSTASITHATVELESSRGSESGMTPAASYVRQHQLQMQQQAEMEAKAARERAEAEAKASKAADTSASNTRQKMIEEEKQKMKSKRGWRKKLGGSASGGLISADAPSGLETTYTDFDGADEHESAHYGGYAPSEATRSAGVSALPPQLGLSYEDNGFDPSFDNEELQPPHMPAAGGAEDSGDEFETDSLRHWGEGIERSRASAANFKNPKSILKKTTSFDQLPNLERPFAGRIRANSYDAPQPSTNGLTLGGGTPSMTQISSTAASVERLDGIARSDSPHSPRSGDESSSARNTPRSASPHGGPPAGVLGHHSNSSMPTLSLMMDGDAAPLTPRSVAAPPQTKKRLTFADEHIYHSTWPAHVYDRRGELATCNRLTPVLAQRIKEELNAYKMEEMAVAASSRIYTHFFV